MRFAYHLRSDIDMLQSCSRNCHELHLLELALFHKRSIGFHFPFLRFFLPLSCGLLFLFSKYMSSWYSIAPAITASLSEKSLDFTKPRRHIDCSKLTLQFDKMLLLPVGSFSSRGIFAIVSNVERFLSEGFPIFSMFVTSKAKTSQH
jgi:hypothetical protein